MGVINRKYKLTEKIIIVLRKNPATEMDSVPRNRRKAFVIVRSK